ncbi:MAG TPA: hypothetical protein PLN21_04320 [Gemmatales bacterium]|nr:hypothetical protein [Gemmatales bacterium]
MNGKRKKRNGYDRRTCAQCKSRIIVGKEKVGRVIFPGGVCFDCYRQTKSKKFK